MGNKIFIGGLSYNTTESSLALALQEFGIVISIRIVTDMDTGRSRGFGFATFSTSVEAQRAIDGLNNTLFEGRRIGVKEAIDKSK